MSQGRKLCEFLSCPFPAEPDDKYCIFHKEHKRTESEVRRFYQGLIEQAEEVQEDEEGNNKFIFQDIDWEQYYFPRVPDDLDFSFKGAVFKGEANFNNTRFLGSMGNIDFRNSKFLGDANFKYVRFKPQTIFSHANFEGKADFEEAVFKGGYDNPYHPGSTSFIGAAFSEVARFNESEFIGNARFKGAVFKERALFRRATFEKESNFDSCRFLEESEFKKVTFEGDVSFRGVTFQRLTDFTEATFGEELSFANASFTHGISIIDAEESDPEYEAEIARSFQKGNPVTELALAIKQFSKFRKGTIRIEVNKLQKHRGGENELLQNKCFSREEENELTEELNQYKGELSSKLNSNEILQFKELRKKFNLLEAKQEGCRVQRISYGQEAKKEEADHMFVEEMKARRKQKNICWRILEYLFADLSCSYGTSWVKVLGWSGFFSLFLFPTLFWWLATTLSGGIYITGENLTAVTTWDGFLYYSLITFTTVGYGDLRPIGQIFKMLSATESALGMLLSALIIVVFARKWMR